MMIQKVCLVSPEIIGPHKNGGIGTHVFYLAKLLSQDPNCQTTVLYTGGIGSETVEHWRQHFKTKLGIRFIHESELAPIFLGNICSSRDHFVRSQRVYHWLKHQDFDVCHFQDYIADGFTSIQAKRTGQAFENTTLTCMAHSSHTWAYQAMQAFPVSVNQLLLDYAERYCMQYADIVISPSEYMFTWMEENHWDVGKNRKVLPCLMDLNKQSLPTEFAKGHIIFFGRLETRKGLELFLDALRKAAPQLKPYAGEEKPIQVTFLGKVSSTTYPDTQRAIEAFFEEFAEIYSHEILSDKSQPQALDFLVNHANALVVTPSLIDNFPCAILECVELGLNVISSNVGGIPEILGEGRLFAPNVGALAKKLESCFKEGIPSLDTKYSVAKTQSLWKELHRSLAESSPISYQPALPESSPLVSVCVPYYNCGEYLPDLLLSLERQTSKNFEVIVVNDGSTKSEDVQIFEAMQQRYADRNWSFVSKLNGGLGNARNHGVRYAKGDYLAFVDADNVAEPEMIERMIQGVLRSDIDCLTSYFRAFDTDHGPFSQIYAYAYTPIGNCTEAGIYENVFGDANLIVKRSVFEALGGFRESKTHTWEDWEFLTRLSLSGYSLDVIPEFLFLYRHRSDSLTRTTSRYGNHLFAVNPYLKDQPLWLQRLLVNSIGVSRYVPGHAEQRVPHLQLKLKEFRQKANQTQKSLNQTQKTLHELEAELEQANARVHAMETSKFWQIRKGWFKVKKILNLPSNE
jgi:O-antigen biosynthesis protein